MDAPRIETAPRNVVAEYAENGFTEHEIARAAPKGRTWRWAIRRKEGNNFDRKIKGQKNGSKRNNCTREEHSLPTLLIFLCPIFLSERLLSAF
jgi:hypothetical protein